MSRKTGAQPNYCPNCNAVLLPGARNCSECFLDLPGVEQNQRKRKESQPPDDKCQFKNNGQRCPLDGTVSENTRGGGPWYCIWHFKLRGEEGQQILKKFIDNPKIVIEIKRRRRPETVIPATAKKSRIEKQDAAARQVNRLLERFTQLPANPTGEKTL